MAVSFIRRNVKVGVALLLAAAAAVAIGVYVGRRFAHTSSVNLGGRADAAPDPLQRNMRDLQFRADALTEGRKRIDLLYAGAENGDYEACGCVGNPLGGLDRRQAYIADSTGATARLLLAAGNFSTAEREPPRWQLERLKPVQELYLRYYVAAGYAAVNVGDRDLAFGVEHLRALGEKLGAPLLSTNVIHAGTKKAAFKPYVVVEAAGERFGVLGFASPAESEADRERLLAAGVEVYDPTKVIDAAVRELTEGYKVRYIVVLSAMDSHVNEVLARAAKGKVHLVLGSNRADGAIAPRDVEGVLLSDTGDRGRHVGHVQLYPGTGSGPIRYLLEEIELRQRLQSVNQRIEQLDSAIQDLELRLRDLVEEEAVAEAKRNLSDAQKERAAVYAESLQTVERYKALTDPKPEDTYMWHRLQPLPVSFRQDEATAALMVDAKTRIAQITGDIRFGGVPREAGWTGLADGKHLGAQTCRSCHAGVYDVWKTTPHYNAFSTLKEADRANADCMACHTTGWKRNGGAFLPAETSSLQGVQCEACHAPGERHAAEMRERAAGGPSSVTLIARNVPELMCASCHAGFHNERFDYAAAVPKVSCTQLLTKAGTLDAARAALKTAVAPSPPAVAAPAPPPPAPAQPDIVGDTPNPFAPSAAPPPSTLVPPPSAFVPPPPAPTESGAAPVGAPGIRKPGETYPDPKPEAQPAAARTAPPSNAPVPPPVRPPDASPAPPPAPR